jgi:hypothetical protein
MIIRLTSPHAPSEQLAVAPIANFVSAAITAFPFLALVGAGLAAQELIT